MGRRRIDSEMPIGRLTRVKDSLPRFHRNKETIPALTLEQTREVIGKRVWEHFNQWMTGQTGIMLEDKKTGKAALGIYKHDVERYLDSVLKGKPTYFD